MSTTEKLQSYIPEIVANGSVQMDIYTRDAEVLDQMSADRLDVFDQMFVEYGTWGLSFWETFLGIDTNESLSYEKRRAYIKERLMAGNFTFTKERLIQVLKFFGYLVTKIEELTDKYMVKIHVSNTITSVKDINKLSNYLRVLFPAHLNCHLLTYDETAASTVNANGVGPLTAAQMQEIEVLVGR